MTFNHIVLGWIVIAGLFCLPTLWVRKGDR
jgi:hypothetical protein